jgi:hypothetical protein
MWAVVWVCCAGLFPAAAQTYFLNGTAVDAGADIVPLGGAEWELPLEICAYRPRRAAGPKLDAVWAALKA